MQHGNCEVYPNILKSQGASARNPCAPLAGQRMNKSRSCVGSALQLCTLVLRDFLESLELFIFYRCKAKGSLQKNRRTSFQNHRQVDVCLCRCLLCWERFPSHRQANSKVKLDEISVVLTKEAGAGNFWQTLSVMASSSCNVSQVAPGPL